MGGGITGTRGGPARAFMAGAFGLSAMQSGEIAFTGRLQPLEGVSKPAVGATGLVATLCTRLSFLTSSAGSVELLLVYSEGCLIFRVGLASLLVFKGAFWVGHGGGAMGFSGGCSFGIGVEAPTCP